MSPLVTQAGPVAHSPGWPPASPAPGPHARGRGSSSGSGVWTASAPGSPLCSHCDRLASSSTAGAVGSAGPGGTVARSSGTCVVFAWSSAGLLQPPRMRTSTPDRDVARRRTEEDEEAITGSFSKKTPPKKTAVSHRWNHYTFKSVLAHLPGTGRGRSLYRGRNAAHLAGGRPTGSPVADRGLGPGGGRRGEDRALLRVVLRNPRHRLRLRAGDRPSAAARRAGTMLRSVRRLPRGTRDRRMRQCAIGAIAAFSHVCRPCPERTSSVEGAGQETAQVVFARSAPASTFARCAVRALHRSICSCAGRRVRFPGAGWSLRPSHDTANKGGVAYPFGPAAED